MIKADVIIPTYKPGVEFKNLIKRLLKQTFDINKIIIINTEREYFDTSILDLSEKIEVHHIKKSEFDHGGTRNKAARLSDADILVFMTQDAKPYNKYTVEELLKPFENDKVCISYGRQVAKPDCNEIEKYTRLFNYPGKSVIKSEADLETMGIKTFFNSNSCSAYRRQYFNELGGFEENVLFAEDMLFAYKAIINHMEIAYCGGAAVLHSHNYSLGQQFKRNFDMGVNQRDHVEIFKKYKSESEGIRLVIKTAMHIIEIGEYLWLLYLIPYSAAKFLGYKLGYNYKKLPKDFVLKCTTREEYFIGK